MELARRGRRGLATALLAILALLMGCGGGNLSPAATTESGARGEELAKEIVLGAGDNGRQVELKHGQILVVSLASNPTTGYLWDVAEVDGTVLRQEGEAEFASSDTGDAQKAGSGGTETYRFVPGESGETTLRLVYHRPWESVEPMETFTLKILVP